MNSLIESLKDEITDADSAVFKKKWPSWIAGILINELLGMEDRPEGFTRYFIRKG